MLLLGVLCLAVGVIANPTIYVPRELGYRFWPLRSVAIVHPEERVPGIPEAPRLDPLPLLPAHEDLEDGKEEGHERLPVIPEAPRLDPLPLLPAHEDSEDGKEEGHEVEEKETEKVAEVEKEGEREGEKESEKEHESEKEGEEELEKPEDNELEKEEEIIPEDIRKPVIVRWDIPNISEWLSNLWSYLPQIQIPHIVYRPIFSNPTAPVVPEAPEAAVETVRYRIRYDPLLGASRLRIIEKK